MTVKELIEQLEKVEQKGATVYIHSSHRIENRLTNAVIEHYLKDDQVVVVLESGAAGNSQ